MLIQSLFRRSLPMLVQHLQRSYKDESKAPYRKSWTDILLCEYLLSSILLSVLSDMCVCLMTDNDTPWWYESIAALEWLHLRFTIFYHSRTPFAETAIGSTQVSPECNCNLQYLFPNQILILHNYTGRIDTRVEKTQRYSKTPARLTTRLSRPDGNHRKIRL